MKQPAEKLVRSEVFTIILCGVMVAMCGCSSSKALDRYIANQERTEPLPPKPTIAYLNEPATALAPGSADVYRLLQAKQYKKAHELTSQMLESELASPQEKAEYYLFRGVTNRLMVNEKAGFDDLNQAIELNPRDWRAYNARREAYENRSMHEKAAEDWEKAKELNPDLKALKPEVADYRVQGGVI